MEYDRIIKVPLYNTEDFSFRSVDNFIKSYSSDKSECINMPCSNGRIKNAEFSFPVIKW